MIKRFENGSYKISSRAALSFLVAATLVFTNGVSVKALDSSNLSETNQIEGISKSDNQFFIDRKLKSYNDINKAQRIAGFNFKLPDYIGSSNAPDSYQIIKASDNNNIAEIYFSTRGNGQAYKFDAFKIDPVEALKQSENVHSKFGKDKKIEVNSEDMNVGTIQGKCITLTITEPGDTIGNETTPEAQLVCKYFVWKDEEINYSLEYNEVYKYKGKEKNWIDINQNELAKTVASLEKLDEIKNVDYKTNLRENQELSTELGVMNIYDKEDLGQARDILGFNPKMPLSINNDKVIKDAVVGPTSDSNADNNKINYEINTFYYNKEYSITVNQSKHDSFNKYNDIKTNGYATINNLKDNKNEKVNVEKVTMDGVEVYKYKEVQPDYEDESKKDTTLCYLWEKDGIYYSLSIFHSDEYKDDIVKEFVNSSVIE